MIRYESPSLTGRWTAPAADEHKANLLSPVDSYSYSDSKSYDSWASSSPRAGARKEPTRGLWA